MEKSLIMIIDDDVTYNELLAAMIKKTGHKAYQVFNGKQASEALLKLGVKPDLVICDIKMPEMSGLQFVKENLEKNFKLNICMISGQVDRDELLEALQFGAVDFITKPVKYNQFYEKISRLLKQ